jgi:hypothetical protein
VLEAGLTLLAALASFAGFALLALSQARHWRAVCGTPLEERVQAAWAAGPGLVAQPAALLAILNAQGPGFGSLLWGVMISAAAIAVALTLSWKPHWLRPLARLLCRQRLG